MQANELADYYKLFTQAFIRWCEKNPVKARQDIELRFAEDEIDVEFVLRFGALTAFRAYLFARHWSESDAVEITKTLIRSGTVEQPTFYTNDGRVIERPSDETIASAVWPQIVSPVVYEMERQKSLSLSDDVLFDVAQKTMERWSKSHLPVDMEYVVPLSCFDMEGGPLEIDGAVVEPFPAQDKHYFQGDLIMEQGWTPWDILESKWRVVRRVALEPKAPQAPGAVLPIAQAFLTSIRLLTTGEPGLIAAIARAPGFKWGAATYSYSEFRKTPDSRPAKLPDSLRDRARVLTSMLAREMPEALRSSLRRFNHSFVKHAQEDRLLDLVIAMETCLLSGLSAELSYRFALRGSKLLRRKLPPKETFAKLRSLYSCRSQVVHKAAPIQDLEKDMKVIAGGRNDVKSAVDEALRLCQSVLLEVIDQLSAGQTFAKIIESIDEEILSGQG